MGAVSRHFTSNVANDLPLEHPRCLCRMELSAAFFYAHGDHILCIDLQTKRDLEILAAKEIDSYILYS